MAYAERKGRTCERAVLRAVRMGNQQRCPDEGSVQRPHGMNPEAGFWYSLLPRETVGIKDYSNYTPDQWYWSTYDEIAYGRVPQGGSLNAVFTDAGSYVFKELVSPATLNAAELRDWQSWDSGVLADIWVRTAASSVGYTGSPSVSYDSSTGATTYDFYGGWYVASNFLRNLSETEYQNHVNAGATGFTEVTSEVIKKPANPTKMSTISFKAPANISKGQKVSINLSNFGYNNVYDCTTWAYYNVITGYKYGAYYPSGGEAGNGGSVTVKPETVARKVLQPASLNAETTRDRKWGWITRVPASAAAQTKTFLVQGGTRAIQSFAFDMDEYE